MLQKAVYHTIPQSHGMQCRKKEQNPSESFLERKRDFLNTDSDYYQADCQAEYLESGKNDMGRERM